MRASYVKENLAAVDGLGAAESRRVRARITPATIARIDTAVRTEWLPVEIDVELTEAVDAELGEEMLVEQNRRSFLAAFQGPLLKPILSSAIALSGATPGALLRFASSAWSSVYRECGEIAVERRDRGAVITWSRLPDPILASRPYLVGTRGVFEGGVELMKSKGRCTLRVDEAARAAIFELEWTRA